MVAKIKIALSHTLLCSPFLFQSNGTLASNQKIEPFKICAQILESGSAVKLDIKLSHIDKTGGLGNKYYFMTEEEIRDLRFMRLSPSKRYWLASSFFNSLRIWDARTGLYLGKVPNKENGNYGFIENKDRSLEFITVVDGGLSKTLVRPEDMIWPINPKKPELGAKIETVPVNLTVDYTGQEVAAVIPKKKFKVLTQTHRAWSESHNIEYLDVILIHDTIITVTNENKIELRSFKDKNLRLLAPPIDLSTQYASSQKVDIATLRHLGDRRFSLLTKNYIGEDEPVVTKTVFELDASGRRVTVILD